MTFKKMRGCRLSYEKQGYIYFACRNYAVLSGEAKKKIHRLCDEVGGEYSDALFAVLTTSKSVRTAAIEYHISERLLYNLRVKFYERW